MANLASTSCSTCTPQACSGVLSLQRGFSSCTSSQRRTAQHWRRSALGSRCSRGTRPSNRLARTHVSAARASMEPEGELDPEIEEGTRIRVTSEVTVYHAPKMPELQLQGKEGSVKMVVKHFKGKELSATLPYRIEFQLDSDSDKPKKFFVHLDASEFEKIQ